MPKLKQISFEPESNQRSKDSQHFIHSALLYQLRYRKMGKPQATTTDQEIQKPNLLRFLREIGLHFVVNASRALLTPDQKVVCSNHVGVRWSLIGVKCLIWTVSFYLAIRSPKKMETWMPKLKQISFEPESNQRSKDSQHFIHSALLYQLRYRKMGKPQATTTDQEIQKT